MFIANLIEQSRLVRKFNVITNEGLYEVIYNGTGMGYEEIIVNGEIACRTNSYLWYVPQFEFLIGNTSAKVEVSVSVWMKIQHFNLIIAGVSVYSE